MKRGKLLVFVIGFLLVSGVTLLNAQNAGSGSARLRVAHAWRSQDISNENAGQVDIYVNDVLTGRAVDIGGSTAYQLISPGSARVSLYEPGTDPGLSPPVLSAIVTVEASQSYTVLLVGEGENNTRAFTTINDNIQPLATSTSRLTLVQANPYMLDVNVLLPDAQRALAYNLKAGDIVGTIDLPADNYTIEIYDAQNPTQILSTLNNIEFASSVNQIMVFVPASLVTGEFTDVLLFRSGTRRTETDVSVQFVNATTQTGSITLSMDGFTQVRSLSVGEMTVPLPVPAAGSALELQNSAGNGVLRQFIGPWQSSQRQYNTIALIYESGTQNSQPVVAINLFLQSPRSAPARSTVRLIHGVTDTVPLNIQFRNVNSQAAAAQDQSTRTPAQEWSSLGGSANFSETSEYAVTTPGVYDVRVVLAGSQNVIAQQNNVILQPGAVYDFVVLAGRVPGEVILQMVQAEPIPGGALINTGDPAVIRDIVDATLTALVPEAVITATRTPTPMPTFSPVPTNTPRPSNTPAIKPPSISVDPAPPRNAVGTFVIYGEGFTPGRGLTIDIGDLREVNINQVSETGTFLISITVPSSLQPGVYPVRACADCRPGGVQEEAFTVIRIGAPNSTPTATAQP